MEKSNYTQNILTKFHSQTFKIDLNHWTWKDYLLPRSLTFIIVSMMVFGSSFSSAKALTIITFNAEKYGFWMVLSFQLADFSNLSLISVRVWVLLFFSGNSWKATLVMALEAAEFNPYLFPVERRNNRFY